jgi:hypothetical protein
MTVFSCFDKVLYLEKSVTSFGKAEGTVKTRILRYPKQVNGTGQSTAVTAGLGCCTGTERVGEAA